MAKDLLFTYLEYLYSIQKLVYSDDVYQSVILTQILSSKEHDSWTIGVLIMIAVDEYSDINQFLIKGGSDKNIMSLEQFLNRVQVINREKIIDNILDK